MNYKSHRTFVRFGLFVSAFLHVTMSAAQPIVYAAFGLKQSNVSIFISYNIVNFLRLFFVMQFCFACNAIRKRFSALNVCLEKAILKKFVSTMDSSSSSFGKIYQSLCDEIENINETFTFHFIFVFGNILVDSTYIFSLIFIHNPVQ